MTNLEQYVEALAKKAANESNPTGAQQFAQAALNIANAMIGLTDLKTRTAPAE